MFRTLLFLAACGGPDNSPILVAENARSMATSGGSTIIATDGGVRLFGGRIFAPSPVLLPPAVEAVLGSSHACVLSTTDTVHCWGDQSRGALGEHRACLPPEVEGGTPDCSLGPAVMAMLPPARALAAGNEVTCAITLEDRVVCWGDPALLGGSRLPPLDPPTPVMAGGEPLAAERLIIRNRTICAIAIDGALWCWGAGFEADPVRQPETGVIDFAFGPAHRCVIDDAGLRCSGNNHNGQVGDIDHARGCDPDKPCELQDHAIALDAKRVVAGSRHTCVLTTGGEVVCFGSNEFGQLGRTDAFLVGDFGTVIDDVVELDAGSDHTCARTSDDFVSCWAKVLDEVAL